MDTIHLYPKKKMILPGLLISIVLLFFFLYFCYLDSSDFEPKLGALFFFLLSLFFLWGLSRRHLASVTDEGITLPSYGFITWEEITGVKIFSFQGRKSLGLRLAKPASKKYSLWQRINHPINHYYAEIHINIGAPSIPIKQAYDIICRKADFKEATETNS